MMRLMKCALAVCAALISMYPVPAMAGTLADAQWLCSHLATGNYSATDIAWAKTLVPDCGVATPAPAPSNPPAPTITTKAISGQTALLNALSGSKGGETFLLAPGSYSANLSGIKPARAVTLQGQPGVKFGAGVIKNSANITFRGMIFKGSAGMGSGAAIVRLEANTGISFEKSAFVNSDHTGWAIYARSAGNSNIRIVGNTFTDLSRGVVFFGGAGIRTESNAFSGIGDDCIDYSNLVPYGAVRNTISRNTARNSFYNPGSHRDFAQLMANRGLDVVANDLWFDGQGINDFGSPKPNTDLNVIGNVVRMINYANAIRFDLPGTTGAANDNQVTSGKVKAVVRIPATMTKRGNTLDGRPF